MKQYTILFTLIVIVFVCVDAQITEEGHVLDNGSIDVLETYVNYDRASVACGYDGLYFYDLTDPVNPVEIFNYSTNRALDCAHDSAFVYIADGSGGFVILNYSDTSNIHTAAVMDDSITGARRITLQDNHAYIADGYNGIHIIDITNGYNPQYIGHYSISSGSARKVQVDNGTAYIACQTAGIDIVNISDKSNPIFIDNIPALYLNDDVYFDNNYLYIADSDSGMTIYDVSVPSSPVFISKMATGNPCLRILKLYDYLYTAAVGFMEIIDVSSVLTPVVFDDMEAYFAKGIGLSDNGYIYVAEGTSGLGIYSTSMSSVQNEYESFDSTGIEIADDISDEINISFHDDINMPVEILIIDKTGRIVESNVFNSCSRGEQIEYDISHFTPGLYFLNLKTEKIIIRRRITHF